MGQPADLGYLMLELRMSVELGSPAETVWDVVGNFNGLPDWHPWVTASVLEPLPGGVGRRVTIDGGAGGRRELRERLVSHDYSQREHAYSIIAGPTPRRGQRARRGVRSRSVRVICPRPASRMLKRLNGCEHSTVLHSKISTCSLVSDERSAL